MSSAPPLEEIEPVTFMFDRVKSYPFCSELPFPLIFPVTVNPPPFIVTPLARITIQSPPLMLLVRVYVPEVNIVPHEEMFPG